MLKQTIRKIMRLAFLRGFARLFCFRSGQPIRYRIVIAPLRIETKTALTPEDVDKLKQDWKTVSGDFNKVLGKTTLTRLRENAINLDDYER